MNKVLIVIGLIALFAIILYAVAYSKSKCPACGRAWAKNLLRKEELDKERILRQEKRQDIIRDASGKQTGSIDRVEIVPYIRTRYRSFFECKHCNHKWDEISATDSREY